MDNISSNPLEPVTNPGQQAAVLRYVIYAAVRWGISTGRARPALREKLSGYITEAGSTDDVGQLIRLALLTHSAVAQLRPTVGSNPDLTSPFDYIAPLY